MPGMIDVLIPALNEEKALPFVLADMPNEHIREVIICDNGSTDRTVDIARSLGATVVISNTRGYGSALLKGMDYLAGKPACEQPSIIVFLDGDYSDFPEYIPALTAPIQRGEADLVIGSRVLGKAERGSLTPVQRFGNWLSTRLIHLLFGQKFTDLGPFRAIAYDKLLELNMQDKNYGWTVEMQVKAAKHKLRCVEIPVPYRARIGQSKVSGTLSGSAKAGVKILWTIFKSALSR